MYLCISIYALMFVVRLPQKAMTHVSNSSHSRYYWTVCISPVSLQCLQQVHLMTPARFLQSSQRMQKKRVHLLFSFYSNCPGLASHWWLYSIQHCKKPYSWTHIQKGWLQVSSCAQLWKLCACLALKALKPECYPSAQQKWLLFEEDRAKVRL